MITRDFIYLDVERVRSLFSQIEEGLIESKTQAKGAEQVVKGKIEGNIPLIGGGSVSTNTLWKKNETETRVLHDHMFNHVEHLLQKSSSFIDVNKRFKGGWDRDTVADSLKPTSFIKMQGKVKINDFAYMSALMRDFHEIGKIISSFSIADKIEGKTKKEKAVARRVAADSMNLPEKKFIDNLATILEKFYGDSIVIKIWPFSDKSDCVFVCRIDKQYLRDSVEDLNFKFGVNPEDDWVLVAQVARIPSRTPQNPDEFEIPSLDFMNQAIQKMFDASGNVIEFFSLKYPFISVTPLAIYRE